VSIVQAAAKVIIPPSPIIAPNVTDLPERFYLKAVDSWVDAIRAVEDKCQNAIGDLIEKYGQPGGTPKSQQKFSARLSQYLGEAGLSVYLRTGKRGRFAFAFDVMSVDKIDGCEREALFCRRIQMTHNGPNVRPDCCEYFVSRISRHALLRLAQRGGVTSRTDLSMAIRQIWNRVGLFEIATRDRRENQKIDRWLVPVRIHSCNEPLLLVISSRENNGEHTCPTLVTVLSWDMLYPHQTKAVTDLDAFLSASDGDWAKAFSDNPQMYVSAFQRVANI
jgi:hypothetical protein